MIIRERFQRTFNRLKYAAVAVVIVLVVGVTIVFPKMSRIQTLGFGLGLGLVIAPVFMIASKGRYRCPRCKEDLAHWRGRELRALPIGQRMKETTGPQFWDVWEACPKCRVRFDEPWDPTG